MSRKKCRRKVYSLVNPIIHAIEGASITPKADLDKLRLAELSAIESFRTARATREDWRTCADMLNIAQTMGEIGIGPEVLPACAAAQQALIAARDRFHAGKPLALDGPGLQALRDVAGYHDAQRTAVCRREYEQAIVKTANRILGDSKALKVGA